MTNQLFQLPRPQVAVACGAFHKACTRGDTAVRPCRNSNFRSLIHDRNCIVFCGIAIPGGCESAHTSLPNDSFPARSCHYYLCDPVQALVGVDPCLQQTSEKTRAIEHRRKYLSRRTTCTIGFLDCGSDQSLHAKSDKDFAFVYLCMALGF